MKKMLIMSLLILISGFTVFASGQRSAAPVDLTKPVSLVLWTHEDVNRSVLEKKLLKEFNAANPNVSVDYQAYPSGKIRELLTVALSANQGPDIFNQHYVVIRDFVLEGRTTALDPAWIGEKSIKDVKSRYIAGTLAGVELDNDLYGLPVECGNQTIYLNKKMLREVGLNPDTDYPKTWEDVMAVSEKIVKRNGDIITRRGFDFRYPEYFQFIPMVEQLGGRLVSEDGKTGVINDNAWLQFFDFFRQWGPKGKNLGGPSYQAARTAFDLDNGTVAMSSSGLYQQGRMRTNNPAFFNSGEWMVIPYPQWKNAVAHVAGPYGVQYYVINAQTSQEGKIWGWRAVDFMLSHGEDYLKDAAVLQPSFKVHQSETYKALPFSNVFFQDMQKAKPEYHGPSSSIISDRLAAAVDKVMLQGEDPKTVLVSFRKEIQDILNQN